MRLHGHVGHTGVGVRGAHGVPDGLVLLDNGEVTLVVLRALTLIARGMIAIVEQELAESDVLLALAGSFDLVHKATESHEGLFHFLMAIVPRFFGSGADVVVPAVREFPCRIVQSRIRLLGHRIVRDRRFQQVARHVPFVVCATLPPTERSGRAISARVADAR